MKNRIEMRNIPFFLTLFIIGTGYAGEPVLITGTCREPLSAYVIATGKEAGPAAHRAAGQLQYYLREATGITLPVITAEPDTAVRQIFIGPAVCFPSRDSSVQTGADGFRLRVVPGHVFIGGGEGKGTLYGVYDLLEKFAGCRFWAPDAETVPRSEEIHIPLMDTVVRPAFAFREVYYAGMDDTVFLDKMRCHRHSGTGPSAWGMWVHTMFSLVPPEKWFETHPGYFALMGGTRARTQLCLTHPDVLKLTIEALRDRMETDPLARYWSVSQMDTYGNCECDACRAIDEREGGPSGTMIAFVNQVAEAFPDKVISTLAYQYTRKAPRHIRPASNVNIMLCTIECDRSRPIESDTLPGSFLHDLRDWSAIAGDILVWDYVIQFTNMIAPFPNWDVLAPNIRLFREYGVEGVFEQGCRTTYSEFQELRQYVLGTLMWNPELNADSLINRFLNGYYGPAAPFVGQYLRGMGDSLHRSGQSLWIYGSPAQETSSFLSPAAIANYNVLFNLAEMSVARDSVFHARVEKARLPLRYAMIELSKKSITGPDGFMEKNNERWIVRPEMVDRVSDFVRMANTYGVKTVHERSLPPDLYGQQTLDFYDKGFTVHLAMGKSCQLTTAPSPKYSAEGMGSLTDGKRGTGNYFVLWQGFEAEDLSAVVDLGAPETINYVGAEFLQDIASWIFYPEKLTISVSEDGKSFTTVAEFDGLSFRDEKLIRETGKTIKPVRTRYIKFTARNKGTCPDWHIGHGGKAWLFADELIVDRR